MQIPQHLQSRLGAGLMFCLKTIVTFGTYPIFWLAKRCPRLHKEALILRARRLEHPEENPSSWPWIRRAWLAWLGTVAFAAIALLVASGVVIPLIHRGQAGTLTLLAVYAIVVLPQLFILVEFATLLWHTIYPERAATYLRSRYAIALGKTEARARAWREKKKATSTC